MNMLVILIWLVFMFGVGFFMLWSVGGGFLLTRIKSRMPFWKGKGKHVLFFDKSGKTRFYYLIPNSDGKIMINDVEYNFISTHHSISDNTAGKGTIHFLDGEPLYIIVQGCPNNILVSQRGYDLDIGKIDGVLVDIDKLVKVNNDELSIKLLANLSKITFRLTGSYRYLRPARKVASDLIILTQELQAGKLKDFTNVRVLNTYKVLFQKLQRVLESRNRTMINFTDYFTANDLCQSFNDQFAKAINIKSIEQERARTGISKFAKIGLGIGVAVVGVMAFLLIQQGGTIDELQLTITSMNTTVNTINDNTGNVPVLVDINASGSPIPVNDTDTKNK